MQDTPSGKLPLRLMLPRHTRPRATRGVDDDVVTGPIQVIDERDSGRERLCAAELGLMRLRTQGSVQVEHERLRIHATPNRRRRYGMAGINSTGTLTPVVQFGSS